MNNTTKKLYNKCAPYLDTKFKENFNKLTINQRYDRIGELNFTNKFIDDSIIDKHISNAGLDIKLKNIARPTAKQIDGWGEYVCAHPDFVNNTPIRFLGKDEDELLSRITSVFYDKNKKINNDIRKGLVKNNEPIILCINLDQLYDNGNSYDLFLMNKAANNLPSAVRTVYPIGKLTATLNLTEPEKSYIGRDYNKYIVKTKTGSNIEQTAFLSKDYSQISAVLFNSNVLGERFILIHNYYAKNPIRRLMFSNCLEYIPRVESCIGGKTLHIKEVECK